MLCDIFGFTGCESVLGNVHAAFLDKFFVTLELALPSTLPFCEFCLGCFLNKVDGFLNEF
ncbi:15251_t:CDS:2 [Dentiscutata erythropus]|uniref:15251_t:CDS:1 n=1 Tax=Dentiscutata erythropus TaxID=1348616 RepID=A0A9N8VDW5_9GLOM|nr:15251_t:CDS:2 [Dentiscutata erythropus]